MTEENKNVSLEAWLLPEQEDETVELKVSEKLPNFIIKKISATRINKLRKQAERPTGRGKQREVDGDVLSSLLIGEAVVEPDLNNATIQEHYGTMGDPDATLQAMLSAGQYGSLSTAINDFSGGNSTLDDMVAEAKK
ncbi:hypothetical protein JC2156_04280 [Weissella koreensis KCTC 3621]|uniref:phage tail assembly chaperone n=1 Tax=Weissella koreensis TaxID=165096 RepID=UPI00026F3649|nr:hypothetical protein [Weissella koreensis]EJF33718.1 hypothetical protein JC2156_05320 [Weissella koreensis KCTC 3621]EJF34120.1 hypothetical protein JC2156_04280 [Weissella koreensis KCTC 3621]